MYGRLIGWLGTMSPREVVIGTALAFFLGWAAEDALEQPARAPDPLWVWFWFEEPDGWHSLCRELVRRPNADEELLQICSGQGSAMSG
jgi:hypothetical protein